LSAGGESAPEGAVASAGESLTDGWCATSQVLAQFRMRHCRWMCSNEPSYAAGGFGRRDHTQHGLSGPLLAAKIVGEAADVNRFVSADAFARYAGVGPVPLWSGRTWGPHATHTNWEPATQHGSRQDRDECLTDSAVAWIPAVAGRLLLVAYSMGWAATTCAGGVFTRLGSCGICPGSSPLMPLLMHSPHNRSVRPSTHALPSTADCPQFPQRLISWLPPIRCRPRSHVTTEFAGL
jgi:hypothetical protein